MLIKLPNTIVSTNQLANLVKLLRSGKYDSSDCEAFFAANSRISRDQKAVKMVVEYLEAIVVKPKELVVEFAQTPDEEFIIELTKWARANIRENILLKVSIDPILTGGVVVRTPQRIYDFSWNNQLNSKRDLLTELVGHVR